MAAGGAGGNRELLSAKVWFETQRGHFCHRRHRPPPAGGGPAGKPAASGPSDRNFKVCLMGHVYRCQKQLSDGAHRWKCFKSIPKFHCLGHIRTDTRSVGLRVLEAGAHSASCDPDPLSIASRNAQRDIIEAGRNLYAPPPQRILEGAMEGASDHLLAALPNRDSLKRKARGAKTRERKKAYAVGPDGSAPNCETLEELRFPPRLLLRPDGDPFLLYDSGSSPERVVIFGAPDCVRVLQNAHVWSSDGTFKAVPPASGYKSIRYTRLSAGS